MKLYALKWATLASTVLGSYHPAFAAGTPNCPTALLKAFRPIGGGGNNLDHPEYDPVPGTAELALAPLNFAPGTQDGLIAGPSPRTISNVIAGGSGTGGVNGQTVDPTLSAWLYLFGQFVDHDISLEETPTAAVSINILVPAGDPTFKAGTSIAMTRDTRDPTTNTIVNSTAGYLDLSQVYGSTAVIAASLRNPDGTLQSSDGGTALSVVAGSFVSGDPRVTENPELTACSTLFMREHNYQVALMKAANPTWTGDQLYNMAKAVTTAEYENIIYTEYLPALLGPLQPYTGYNPNVKAQVTQEFSTAAFRVGHTQVSDTEVGLDDKGNQVFSETLGDAFFNTPATDESNGIDNTLRSVGQDNAQATDPFFVATLRNLLHADLVGGDIDEIDLIAIDIQRERDAGLGTLNQTRAALGFTPYTSFAQLTSDPVIQKLYASVYPSIDQVDLFMGGLAEAHASGAAVGQTFQAILSKQFYALRTGDRFFWQNESFEPAMSKAIGQTTLQQILERNIAGAGGFQPHMFIQENYPYSGAK